MEKIVFELRRTRDFVVMHWCCDGPPNATAEKLVAALETRIDLLDASDDFCMIPLPQNISPAKSPLRRKAWLRT